MQFGRLSRALPHRFWTESWTEFWTEFFTIKFTRLGELIFADKKNAKAVGEKVFIKHAIFANEHAQVKRHRQ